MKKFIALLLAVLCIVSMFAGCGKETERIIIYTSANDDRIAHMTNTLKEKFPNYEFIVEYQSTSKVTAKLTAEGTATECDIIHDLAYLSLAQLAEKDLLADLSSYDTSVYTEDCVVSPNYLVECRTGGAIIVNTEVLAEKGLEKPTCYEDLLKPEYKGLVSMPDPKSSGTGYMFVKSLVNAWGEEKAFEYFEALSENVLQFTSSGNGPVNALVQKEVAIGLGMTANAAVKTGEGAALEILFFEEGSPYTMYGQSMIKGKETRACVKEVFDFLINEYTAVSCSQYAPEQIYKDTTFTVEHFPESIVYADMSGDTVAEKERLLALWSIT